MRFTIGSPSWSKKVGNPNTLDFLRDSFYYAVTLTCNQCLETFPGHVRSNRSVTETETDRFLSFDVKGSCMVLGCVVKRKYVRQ